MPAQAGIISVIAKATQVNLVFVPIIGTLIAFPLIVLMVVVFKQWGLWAALGMGGIGNGRHRLESGI
ncbi:MAG: hypothetical protein WCY09_05110 [Candidatus Omnitrophota bacterium]